MENNMSLFDNYIYDNNSVDSVVSKNKYNFKFIDLFAGIGGFHIAMEELGGECVFASEWDENCRKTYTANFSQNNSFIFDKDGVPNKFFCGDITKFNPEDIPDHDVLCAGFPCQPFSQAGYKLGFEDTRGTLFFNVAEIIKIKKPKAVFLENVRGLLNHDNGKTFKVIQNTINELGYKMYYNIVKASDFNLPQHRPRLFMICIRNDIKKAFLEPQKMQLTKTMSDIFDGAAVNRDIGFTLRVGGKGSAISDRRNWDGYIVNGKERRLKPKEAKRMQGFSDDYIFPVSDTEAMKQLGNSVAIPAIKAYGESILKTIY